MKLTAVVLTILAISYSHVSAQSATVDPSVAPSKIEMMRPPPPTPVIVLNLPEVQAIDGSVAVSNLPAVQTVGGTVNVGNLPLDADGALRVSNSTGKFIGVTATAVPGTAGWRNLNLACNAEFGAAYPTARMCTSWEILRTPVTQWPSLSGNSWVQPVIVSAASAGYVDMSGRSAGTPPELSCNAWSGEGTSTGLAVLSNGGFGLQGCLNGTVRVSCCADVM